MQLEGYEKLTFNPFTKSSPHCMLTHAQTQCIYALVIKEFGCVHILSGFANDLNIPQNYFYSVQEKYKVYD